MKTNIFLQNNSKNADNSGLQTFLYKGLLSILLRSIKFFYVTFSPHYFELSKVLDLPLKCCIYIGFQNNFLMFKF